MADSLLTIGTLAKRSGIAASALRFYEDKGLIRSVRSAGQQRRFPKDTLRRVAFIRIAQTMGLSLDDIGQTLATLPEHRTPTVEDWTRLSQSWRPLLQERIDTLCRLRDTLDGCIGCGCLSLQKCQLYNPSDCAAKKGSGPRYLLADVDAGSENP